MLVSKVCVEQHERWAPEGLIYPEEKAEQKVRRTGAEWAARTIPRILGRVDDIHDNDGSGLKSRRCEQASWPRISFWTKGLAAPECSSDCCLANDRVEEPTKIPTRMALNRGNGCALGKEPALSWIA